MQHYVSLLCSFLLNLLIIEIEKALEALLASNAFSIYNSISLISFLLLAYDGILI